MTNWIEHDGGPQPVGDDVWVEVEYPIIDPAADPLSDVPCYAIHMAGEHLWDEASHYRILNDHLIDAARLEGIRLGLEAAHKAICALPVTPESDPERVQDDCADSIAYDLMINIETIAREAQDMGSGKETT